MRGLFLPPEARDPGESAWLTRLALDRVSTPDRITLGSLLVVTLTVTAGVTYIYLPLVLPGTAVVAVAFWHFGRRITRAGALVKYCFTAGPLAGVLNSWISALMMAVFNRGDMAMHMDANTFGLMTVLGACVGFAYGAAYLVPMLDQRSARSLRRTEGVDRSLVCCGLWGVFVPLAALSAAQTHLGALGPRDSVLAAAFAGVGGHLAMFITGTLRFARRRLWLARVRRGKVAGWHVCEPERFHRAELERLERFCQPLFVEAPDTPRVLARSIAAAGEAYRSVPVAPKFLVV